MLARIVDDGTDGGSRDEQNPLSSAPCPPVNRNSVPPFKPKSEPKLIPRPASIIGMVRDAGFEPVAVPSEIKGSTGCDTQIDSQRFENDPETALICAVWPKLPEVIRAAVVAIVRPYQEPDK